MLRQTGIVGKRELLYSGCRLTFSVHCSLLAEDAIKSAIKDYQTKREKRLAMAAVNSHHFHGYTSNMSKC